MARERQHISQRQLEATLGREGIPPRFQSRTFAAFTATTVRPAQRPLWRDQADGPLKLFLPMSAVVFCAGLGSVLDDYLSPHLFSTMSALLFTVALILLMAGVVLEQLTALSYRDASSHHLPAEPGL